MRNMPKIIHDPTSDLAIEVPSIPADLWLDRLEKIAGRPLTGDEKKRANKMGAHNWTLRVTAEHLFGDDIARAAFPVHTKPAKGGGA